MYVIVIAALANSCRYKEGPAISFRSPRSRLIGDWQVTDFVVDGIDKIQLFNDSCGCLMYIIDDVDHHEIMFGNCKNYNTGGSTGFYSFSNNYKILKIFFEI